MSKFEGNRDCLDSFVYSIINMQKAAEEEHYKFFRPPERETFVIVPINNDEPDILDSEVSYREEKRVN